MRYAIQNILCSTLLMFTMTITAYASNASENDIATAESYEAEAAEKLTLLEDMLSDPEAGCARIGTLGRGLQAFTTEDKQIIRDTCHTDNSNSASINKSYDEWIESSQFLKNNDWEALKAVLPTMQGKVDLKKFCKAVAEKWTPEGGGEDSRLHAARLRCRMDKLVNNATIKKQDKAYQEWLKGWDEVEGDRLARAIQESRWLGSELQKEILGKKIEDFAKPKPKTASTTSSDEKN